MTINATISSITKDGDNHITVAAVDNALFINEQPSHTYSHTLAQTYAGNAVEIVIAIAPRTIEAAGLMTVHAIPNSATEYHHDGYPSSGELLQRLAIYLFEHPFTDSNPDIVPIHREPIPTRTLLVFEGSSYEVTDLEVTLNGPNEPHHFRMCLNPENTPGLNLSNLSISVATIQIQGEPDIAREFRINVTSIEQEYMPIDGLQLLILCGIDAAPIEHRTSRGGYVLSGIDLAGVEDRTEAILRLPSGDRVATTMNVPLHISDIEHARQVLGGEEANPSRGAETRSFNENIVRRYQAMHGLLSNVTAETVLATAEDMDITPNQVGQALRQFQSRTSNTPNSQQAQMEERLAAAGMEERMAEVARSFGMSAERVGQAVRSMSTNLGLDNETFARMLDSNAMRASEIAARAINEPTQGIPDELRNDPEDDKLDFADFASVEQQIRDILVDLNENYIDNALLSHIDSYLAELGLRSISTNDELVRGIINVDYIMDEDPFQNVDVVYPEFHLRKITSPHIKRPPVKSGKRKIVLGEDE